MKEAGTLAVFDANAADVVKTIPLASPNALVAAGAKKFLVAFPDQRLIQRWDFGTMTRELSNGTSPIAGRLKVLTMGSDSDGPALAAWSPEAGNLRPGPLPVQLHRPRILEGVESRPGHDRGLSGGRECLVDRRELHPPPVFHRPVLRPVVVRRRPVRDLAGPVFAVGVSNPRRRRQRLEGDLQPRDRRPPRPRARRPRRVHRPGRPGRRRRQAGRPGREAHEQQPGERPSPRPTRPISSRSRGAHRAVKARKGVGPRRGHRRPTRDRLRPRRDGGGRQIRPQPPRTASPWTSDSTSSPPPASWSPYPRPTTVWSSAGWTSTRSSPSSPVTICSWSRRLTSRRRPVDPSSTRSRPGPGRVASSTRSPAGPTASPSPPTGN